MNKRNWYKQWMNLVIWDLAKSQMHYARSKPDSEDYIIVWFNLYVTLANLKL